MKDSLEIYYNKSKISTRLIPISCLMVFLPYEVVNLLFTFFHRSHYYIKIILPFLVVAVACFLVVYYYLYKTFRVWLKKYFFKKPVLIIDDKGITDKIGYGSVGFIPWNNIKKVSSFTSNGHNLVVFVENIDELIGKFKKKGKKRKVASEFKKNGSNIRIAVKWLDGNIYSMKKFAQTKLEENKAKQTIQEAVKIYQTA